MIITYGKGVQTRAARQIRIYLMAKWHNVNFIAKQNTFRRETKNFNHDFIYFFSLIRNLVT